MDGALKQIENVFRESSSPEELFDTFSDALKIPITDINTYKILLGNPALSCDEVKMFSEKLIEQFPQDSYETLLWAGKILESKMAATDFLEDSIRYYKRAFYINPLNELPLVHLIHLYCNELNYYDNASLLSFIESAVRTVHKKSRIYFMLSDIYQQKGDTKKAEQYILLGQKSAEREP